MLKAISRKTLDRGGATYPGTVVVTSAVLVIVGDGVVAVNSAMVEGLV